MNSETNDDKLEVDRKNKKIKEDKAVRRIQFIMVGVVSPILITIAILMGFGILPKGF
jgi:hypothetical protein